MNTCCKNLIILKTTDSAGIEMSESLLYHESRNAHLSTKGFDRTGENGEKIQILRLCALAHIDFNSPYFYSYEVTFNVIHEDTSATRRFYSTIQTRGVQ